MCSRLKRCIVALGAGALVLSGLTGLTAQAAPGAVIGSADCVQHQLPANDDLYTDRVPLPFGINFHGTTFESLYVNNNGNVTFDYPLSDYTPFGLANAHRQIIAPFFADVDTRVGNTVWYGWGNTTYEGHRAFCVDWVGVGYYDQHTDKLNSFQLLLVQREDADVGDFDIVFNYDSIQWETGDASGGTGGVGGASAVAGFSNGSELPDDTLELTGSMHPGAFLDTNPTGLANTHTDSNIVGRHVFAVRSVGAPLVNYVALGDSFQSGEGAGDYIDPTDTLVNHCHRSAHAYPKQLVEREIVVNLRLNFWACSGATIDNLSAGPSPDGRVQLERLGADTKLVTIGIGGNDLNFANLLINCVHLTTTDLQDGTSETSCQQAYGSEVDENFRNVVQGGALQQVYQQLRQRAPFARIVVLTYPRFYVEGGSSNRPFDGFCQGARMTDQRWINSVIRQFDDAIQFQASSLGLQVVDIYNAPEGHELCGPSDQFFMNGINVPLVESYHPNAFGHTRIANEVGGALHSTPPGNLFNVQPGQTIIQQLAVGPGPELNVSTQWPGSDVVLSLTSPSGHNYTRTTAEPGVWHVTGPTFETYSITNPEVGMWTATLFGSQVAPEGEETRLFAHNPPAPNVLPSAVFTQSFSDRTITVDATASDDIDGSLVEYVWDFGDGTTATGNTANHTYTTPGTYLTTLAVKDDRGGEAFTNATNTVTIPRYTFTGFGPPVSNQPTVNTMQAGRAVPLKFSLGGDYGLDILAPGSPGSTEISCDTQADLYEVEQTSTAGTSTLTYDTTTGLYQYVWKTDTQWAGTCRRVTLTLDDGSLHQALFRFRN